MEYDEIAAKLNAGGFYPALSVRVKNKSRIVEGLRIDSPPILKDDREERINKIIGEDCLVTWIGNENNYFLIKKKQS